MYYRHSEQIALLAAGKSVQWGKRQFFSGPNAVDDIIFCSERAKMILQDRWENLEFWPVKKYNTSNYITGVYQLFFSECLPVEAFKGGHPTTCSKCGRKMIRITKGIQQLEISRKYFQNSNSVYRTGDILTEQFIGYATFSLNIVSQEFYQYCEANQMNRGMIYEPIKLI